MSKTVRIRNLDDDVYAGLVRRAAQDGVTVSELLRGAATRLAGRLSMAEWLRRCSGHTPSQITTADVLTTLDGWRGDWPDAGH